MATKDELDKTIKERDATIIALRDSNDVLRKRIKELELQSATAQAEAQEAMARLHAELHQMHGDCGQLRLYVAGQRRAEVAALAPIKSKG